MSTSAEGSDDIAKIRINGANQGTLPKTRIGKLTKAELKRRREQRRAKGPWGSWSSSSESDHETELKKQKPSPEDNFVDDNEISDTDGDTEETSTFYGKTEKDYQGRGFLHPPTDIDTDLHKPVLSYKCYLPKRTKYTLSGHINGTTSLKLLPKTGHLILSGGNDNVVKIWDFYHDRKVLRDYKGHSKAIKSLCFNDDGTKFISSSFDRTVKIWDTESGSIQKKLRFGCIPNAIKFRPLNSNEFIVGLSNSKIYHYDDRISAKDGRVQVYDHHMSSILALEYFPDGSKFISSSEDKTVRLWENQINIPIKQISDTAQHSMPYISIHPEEKYFCTQSMDNTIYTYGMKPKYKTHPKKVFKGQTSAGYGIGITFSSDGRYICSGDAKSKVHIWDWTTIKLLSTISIPGGKPITQVEWNPQETSKVVCSGASGKIYVVD
ncbi:Cdc40p NDAI_0B05630 [Naumovozyma dairenensis CBS 421]|uniref:Pre-mRNA-processing factor 17 n=1 Tax=Naumovozyma dairenensis (strain ATCC 10597 / BCRC 20456 / CBS 421 / NBRC 0211 / NRRL Y-12639) TaxID=1071378 RepID=G0W735_NAUDC|nr:hypothetical protein NDAI_0B05630 [Naumovozyma dairenensis CBS 421]CCD23596.1 hypothetical protein NDAI_0B05630 [Naumovozyma dairenensis CBS 421]